jgi:hypothetical protein
MLLLLVPRLQIPCIPNAYYNVRTVYTRRIIYSNMVTQNDLRMQLALMHSNTNT